MINTNLTPPTTPIESPASDAFDPGAFAGIPLTALSRETHLQLSKLLNMKKILRSEDGYERDYRGIGMLAELRGMYDENSGNMDKVLQLWCSVQPKSATFGKLEEYLGKIDRWDVSDDIHENLVKDANTFNAKQLQKSVVSLANTRTHNGNPFDDTDSYATRHINDDTNDDDDDADDNDWSSKPNILTRDDVLRAQKNLPPQQYDAFVLFAKEDVEYAMQMLVLENDYNFKLCLKDRDLLAGVEFMHVALPQLIDERCKYLIALLTDQFFKSPENKFLMNFTQAHQIEDNRRKIIPVRYGNVTIPRTLSILTHLTYQQSSRFYDFWDRLADSIRHGRSSLQHPINGQQKSILNTVPADMKGIMRNNKPKLNLSQVTESPNITAITPTAATTPSPAISEIPSISLNGEAIFPEDDDQKHDDPKLNQSNGHGVNGMRRSATIGANMFTNNAINHNNNNTNNNNNNNYNHNNNNNHISNSNNLSKEHKHRSYMKSTSLVTQSSHSSDQSMKNDSGCGKYKKRLPRFSKFLPKLRRANSTSQINTLQVNMCERTTSFSDLSMHSGISGCGSEQPTKKKKKWSHKLKRIFSRSSVKLQETA